MNMLQLTIGLGIISIPIAFTIDQANLASEKVNNYNEGVALSSKCYKNPTKRCDIKKSIESFEKVYAQEYEKDIENEN